MQKSDVAGRARPSETPPSEAVTKLNEIIERLEKATGPDRDLDCVIYCATAESPFVSYYPDCVLATLGGFAARVEIKDIPRYTASVDAALTLVPKGYLWQLKHGIGCEAVVWSIETDYGDRPKRVPVGSHMDQPALALCIAALRARASRDTPSSPEETEASQAKPPHTPVED